MCWAVWAVWAVQVAVRAELIGNGRHNCGFESCRGRTSKSALTRTESRFMAIAGVTTIAPD